MIQLNSKSIAIFIMFLGLFVVSCNQVNYTEINGFGGGSKTMKTKVEPKEMAQLGLTTDVKYDTSVLLDMATEPSLPNSDNQFAKDSRVKKPKINHTKTIQKMNKIFHWVLPKSMHREFDKKVASKASIFGYQGDNDGMTIGYNILMYGLFAVVLGLTLGSTILTNVNPESNIDNGGCFVLFLVILGFFSLIIGGLIFFISMLVAYS
jgi:hypothetical protein